MDTPPGLRGSNYATHLSARCPSMHQCEVCKGCTNYNPHDLVCAICEGRKPVDYICKHTDEQQLTIKKLSELFHQPMFHPDKEETEIASREIAHEAKQWDETLSSLSSNGLGKIEPYR